MFTKESHRAAVHSSGFKVYSIDFYTICYEDDNVKATVETDFLDTAPPLYSGSLKVTASKADNLSAIESDEIISRISQALQFLNINHEVVTEPSE